MKKRSIGRGLRAAALLGVIGAVSSGCYSRVVDAKGIGADQRHPTQSEATKPVRARELWSNSDDEK